jgi:cbb3-type cytochrome oxidase subunit 3
MEQAIIIIMSFFLLGIIVCIIGIIYALYDDKRKAAQSGHIN